MRDAILERLRALGAEERLAREADLAAQLERLERELAEVQQLVPAWDRVLFFRETADKLREKEILRTIASVREDLERTRERLRADHERVGDELPPFRIASRIERALALGTKRGPLAHERTTLVSILERAADDLEETWTPSLDGDALLERISLASGCDAAAAKPIDARPHPTHVHAPATADSIAGIAARALRAGRYFDEQERTAELVARRRALTDEYEAAADAVPFFHKLNPFSFSEAETKRNELGDRLRATEDELRLCRAGERRLLEESLAAYPPLALRRRVLETLGVATLAEEGREPVLLHGGTIEERPADPSRVLLVASLARLERAFRGAFAGVPFPAEVARDLGRAAVPPRRTPFSELVASYVSALATAGLEPVLARALEHAALRASALEARSRKQHVDALARERHELATAARRAGASVVPFRLRDEIVAAMRAVEMISATSGEFPRPPLVAVLGRDEALGALSSVKKTLDEAWGVPPTRRELMEELSRTTARPVVVTGDPRRLFRPLTRDELTAHVAHRLEGTGFRETVARLDELAARERAASAEKAVVTSRLSFWDRINLFSKTADKQRRRELSSELGRLDSETRTALESVQALLEQALLGYPPALLRLLVDEAIEAVRAIDVAVQVRVDTIVVDDSDPFARHDLEIVSEEVLDEPFPAFPEPDEPDDPPFEDDDDFEEDVHVLGGPGDPPPGFGRPPRSPRRPRWPRPPRPPRVPSWPPRSRRRRLHVRRYSVTLEGKPEATAALVRLAARFVAGFGPLPGHAEMLEAWAREPG